MNNKIPFLLRISYRLSKVIHAGCDRSFPSYKKIATGLATNTHNRGSSEFLIPQFSAQARTFHFN